MIFRKKIKGVKSIAIKDVPVSCPDYTKKEEVLEEQVEILAVPEESTALEEIIEEMPIEEEIVGEMPVVEEEIEEEVPVIEEEIEEVPTVKEKKFKRKKKSRKKRFAAILLLLLLCLGGGALFYFGIPGVSFGTEVYVEKVASLTQIGSGNGMQNRYAGVVESQNIWNVMHESDKTVKEIYVKEGDVVKKGDKLFEYDNEEAKLSLEQAKLELERMESEIKAGEAEIANLEREKSYASSSAQIEYTIQIQSQKAANKKTEYEIKSQKAKIESLEKAAENSVVTSELGGTVKRINTNFVSGSSEVDSCSESDEVFMSVLADGDYRIRALVNEQNQWMVEAGTPVIVRSRVDSAARWTGTISEVDLENPEASGGEGYSSETDLTGSSSYPFYVHLDTSEGLILGQHVYIEMDEGQDALKEGLWLDAYYIVQEEEKAYVWAESSTKHLEKRTVTLGEYDEVLQKYEITGGLSGTDYIAFPEDDFNITMRTTRSLEQENTDPDNGWEEEDLENAVGKGEESVEVRI